MNKYMFKSSDSRESLQRYFDFPFILTVIALSVLIGIFEAYLATHYVWVPSIERLKPLEPIINSVNNSLSMSTNFHLGVKLSLLWATSFFLPILFFSTFSRIIFYALEKNTQRLITMLCYLFYCLLSYAAFILLNPIWRENSFWNFFSFFSPGFLIGIRSLFVTFISIALTAGFIVAGRTIASKYTRIVILFLTIFFFLFTDWRNSKERRTVHPANLTKNHTFVLFFPNLNTEKISEILKDPEMQDFADKWQFTFPVTPSSNNFLPQFVSTLTSLEPYQHGVRTNYPRPSNAKPVAEYVKDRFKDLTLHTTSLGTIAGEGYFLSSQQNNCALSTTKLIIKNRLEKALFPASQLPLWVLSKFFSEYDCSQIISSTAHLSSNEFSVIAKKLKTETTLMSLWYFQPEETPSDKEYIKEIFLLFQAHLERMNLWKNSHITIVGLDEVQGSFSQFGHEDIATTLEDEDLAISSTDIFKIILKEPLSLNRYKEVLATEGLPLEIEWNAKEKLGVPYYKLAPLRQAILNSARSQNCDQSRILTLQLEKSQFTLTTSESLMLQAEKVCFLDAWKRLETSYLTDVNVNLEKDVLSFLSAGLFPTKPEKTKK